MTHLVTGATGKAGRHVVDHLLEAGVPVRALTRDPERAALPPAVDVVRGDLQDAGSLAAAFAGVTAAHLLTSGGDDYATLTTGPQLAALAERAGVQRVTLLWNGFAGPVEAAFAATPLAWTRLEPGNFMGNARFWHVEPDGAVREPYPDTPDAPVHEADVGAVAGHVLLHGGHVRERAEAHRPRAADPARARRDRCRGHRRAAADRSDRAGRSGRPLARGRVRRGADRAADRLVHGSAGERLHAIAGRAERTRAPGAHVPRVGAGSR